MATLALDTHRYVKRLKSVGFTEEQAEAHAEAFGEALTDQLATKGDLLALKSELEKLITGGREDIASVRADLTKEISLLRIEFRDAQATLIRWLVPMMIGQTALVAALVKLL